MSFNKKFVILGTFLVCLHLAGSVRGSSVRKLQQSCRPGEAKTASGCLPCAIGYYAPTGNEAQCLACPGGFTNDQPGSASCSVCAAGYGTSSCTPCPEGFFSRGNTTADCQPCPVFKLTECAKTSYCNATTGPVIEWRAEGSKCMDGKGICQNHTCVCKPGHGGPDCAPCKEWTSSPGGSLEDCRPCPIPGLAPFSCIKSFFCDPVTGFGFTYKEDGADCGAGKGVCKNTTCECPASQGGELCAPCKRGFWSPGGQVPQKCRPCPQQAMCRRLKGPCEMAPPCDSATGKPTDMCWVPKPEGAACKPPRQHGNKTHGTSLSSMLSADSGKGKGSHYCKSGDCIPREGVNVCEQYPCTQPLDCGLTRPPICPQCKDLSLSGPSTKNGRRCVCPKGYKYNSQFGCLPK